MKNQEFIESMIDDWEVLDTIDIGTLEELYYTLGNYLQEQDMDNMYGDLPDEEYNDKSS